MGASKGKQWIEIRPPSDPRGGERAPQGRSIPELLAFGIVPVDKPAGPTSHDVVEEVKAILRAEKAGHGGTLDPKVTGVLPVFLNRATRLSSLLLLAGKTYEARARFHGEIDREAVRTLARAFLGEILQRPPVRSRVKRQTRPRTIYGLDVLAVRDREVHLRIDCQAGTYIRKLIHDMGERCGTGAHMVGLRRIRAGVFREREAVDLASLRAAFEGAGEGLEEPLRRVLVPGEHLAALLPRLVIDDGAARAVARGAKLAAVGLLRIEIPFTAGDRVAILGEDGSWIALGEALMDGERVREGAGGLVAIPRRVVSPPGWH
ncbi:MAG: RNA-guided pseudouridylation complex pseudouridine synthase subunit Cbf5 [Planctomycetota bacterium]|jgi:H/ACA ribonucleoprotein complex subunit 4